MDKASKALFAEFVGTYALVCFGALTMMAGIGVTGAALAHGFVIIAMIYAIGSISGAHLNPAVTLGITLSGRMNWNDTAIYWGAQFFASLTAGFTIWLLASNTYAGYGETTLAPNVHWIQGIAIESILTFFLVFTVLMTAVYAKDTSHAALAVGFTLAFCILAGAGLTGASLNPARTLGPAIFAGNLGVETLVYFIGPALGATGASYLAGALAELPKGRSR